MAGDALMRDGEAIARNGEALAASASSNCCCVGGCTCVTGPGCYTSGVFPPGVEQFDSTWTPDPNGPVSIRHNNYIAPAHDCCCRNTMLYTVHVVRYSYLNNSQSSPLEITCPLLREKVDGSWTNRAGTYTYTREEGTNCSLGAPVAQELPGGNACFPIFPSFPAVAGNGQAVYSGWARLNCSVYEGDFYAPPSFSPAPQGTWNWVRWTFRITLIGDPSPCATPGCHTGACCPPGGQCIETTPEDCLAVGGAFRGPGTHCAGVNCLGTGGPSIGSCCLPSGQCIDTDAVTCSVQQGTFRQGVSCAQQGCPQPPVAACCLPDHSCAPLTQAACLAQNGAWNPGLDCGQVNCLPPPQTGACCYPVITGILCDQLTQAQCAAITGGEWHGPNTVCESEPCTGACCYCDSRNHRQCIEDILGGCSAIQGTFMGYGTVCGPETCTGLPACGPFGLRGNTVTGFSGSRSFF